MHQEKYNEPLESMYALDNVSKLNRNNTLTCLLYTSPSPRDS